MSGERYVSEVAGYPIVLEADRLRRERQELVGELTIRCTLPSARTIDGVLSTADFNFSSARAREDRAKLLKERARTNGEVDWFLILEEFTQQVFKAEREGDPAIDLRQIQRPERDEIRVGGFAFPRRHPSCVFGDGGSAKTYTELYLAGQLAQRGLKVGLFDWELSGEDHRDRLERLFGVDM